MSGLFGDNGILFGLLLACFGGDDGDDGIAVGGGINEVGDAGFTLDLSFCCRPFFSSIAVFGISLDVTVASVAIVVVAGDCGVGAVDGEGGVIVTTGAGGATKQCPN